MQLFKIIVLIGLWLFLFRQVKAQNVFTSAQTGHSDGISALQFSNDGERLYSGSSDGSVVAWDLRTGLQLLSFSGHEKGVSSIAEAKDNSGLFTSDYVGNILISSFSSPGKVLKKVELDKYYLTAVASATKRQSLCITTKNYNLIINDIETSRSERIKFEDELMAPIFYNNDQNVLFGCRSGRIYSLDLNKELRPENIDTIYRQKDRIVELAISPSGKNLAIGISRGGLNRGGILQVLNIKYRGIILSDSTYLNYEGEQPNSISFMNEEELLYLNQHSQLHKLNIQNGKTSLLIKERRSHFCLNLNKKLLATSEDERIELYSLSPFKKFKELKGVLNKANRILGLNNSELLVEHQNGIIKWDLANIIPTEISGKANDFSISHISFSPDLSIQAGGSQTHMSGFTTPGNSFLDRVLYEQDGPMLLSKFSPGGKYLAILDEEKSFCVYNVAHQMNVLCFKIQDELRKLTSIEFSDDEEQVILLGSEFHSINLSDSVYSRGVSAFRNTSTILPGTFVKEDSFFVSSTYILKEEKEPAEKGTGWKTTNLPNGNYLNERKGILLMRSADSLDNIPLFFGLESSSTGSMPHITALYWSKKESLLWGLGEDNVFRKWDLNDGTAHGSFALNESLNGSIAVSNDERLLFALTKGGKISIFETKGLTKLADIMAGENGAYMAVDSNGYYKRSKSSYNAASFTKVFSFLGYTDLTALPMEQFDLHLNRPHVLLKELNYSDAETIAAFSAGFEKRKQLGGLSLDDLFDYETPEVQILNSDSLPLAIDKNRISLKLRCKPGEELIEKLKIEVNGVPLNYSFSNEKEFYRGEVNSWINIDLNPNDNHISVLAEDAKGMRSERSILRILNTAQNEAPNLLIFALSVSNYKDKSKNLKYAVKDGEDFCQLWMNEAGKVNLGYAKSFKKVKICRLFNENAVKKNLELVSDLLNKTSVNDQVIFYISGHGLLDKNKDFFFATHDVDFDDPSKNGISFSAIEDLLSQAPARNRLLLMDACHSGSLDKTSIKVVLNSGEKVTISNTKKRGTDVEDLQYSEDAAFGLVQDIFNNFSESSGSVVISAAAGTGFALESDRWNNGIFTFALLKGLKHRYADLNDDGEIRISELSRYVSQEVYERTNGAQKPSERQENLLNNFRIW